MKQYLLLLKGKKELDYSPEQLQKRLEEYRVWVNTIEEHYVADNRLERIGAHISQKNEIATDGPFLEAKEIIAGFIIIRATNLDEAVTISNSSPLLNYFEIYVRPMLPNDNISTNQLTEHFFRHNYAKMVAILVRYFGLSEVEIAEDIVQDTLVEAMEKWSIQSIPNNPEGWLMDVAKKKTINFLKRNQNFETKITQSIKANSFFEMDESVERDSTLRMIFTCCHPDLPSESQIALALKTLCGLSVGEISNALLTTESTVNKRLYRAKQKFRDGSVSFQIPKSNDLTERLDNVFSTLYLLFNEGYYSSQNEKIIRIDLCFEAIRLLKDIIAFYPNSFKAKALLSLMLLSIARFESRIDEKGAIVILSEQNRNLWDEELIVEGIEYLHQSTQSNEVTIYHLQAGIAAEHCAANNFESTNWKSIYQQYSILEKLNKSAIITFNKTIAKFYALNKNEALKDLLSLINEPELQKSTQYFTSIGVFYTELNQREKAEAYFNTALKLSKSVTEKALIEYKMNN